MNSQNNLYAPQMWRVASAVPSKSLRVDAHARPVASAGWPLFTPLTDAPEAEQGALLS